MTTEITEEQLPEIFKKYDIVIIDVWAEWCGPCMTLGNLFEQELVPRLKDHPTATLVKIHSGTLGKDSKLRRELGIQYIPTVGIYHKGKLIPVKDREGKDQPAFVGSDSQMPGKLLKIIGELEKR